MALTSIAVETAPGASLCAVGVALLLSGNCTNSDSGSLVGGFSWGFICGTRRHRGAGDFGKEAHEQKYRQWRKHVNFSSARLRKARCCYARCLETS